jgi:outer membrane immunogenic protein
MRWLLVAVGLIAPISGAAAQEFELPTLRGSQAFAPNAPDCCTSWGGFYVGGQVGFGTTSADFSTATQDLVAQALNQTTLEAVASVSTWQVLGKAYPSSATYGFMVGYNVPWESLVLGVEANYNRTNFLANAPVSPLFINTSDGINNYNVNLTGSASMRITDVLTLRGRAGYVMGNFLPFATFGVAVGRADLARSATVTGQQNPTAPPDPLACDPVAAPPCIPFAFSQADRRSGAFIYGWAIGGGLEVMVMPHVFLRGEYEAVAFSPIWNITAIVQTARLGTGFKF